MLQNMNVDWMNSAVPLSFTSSDEIKTLSLSRQVKESSFTECNMMSNVSHTGGIRWQTIVVVQVISLKTVKEHQKQVVKVASTAAGTSKMTRNAHQKLVKKGAKAAAGTINASCYSLTS